MNLHAIIAWRDSLYRKWARSLGVEPPLGPKNPRRVEGGKKAAITRKTRKAEARMRELYGTAEVYRDDDESYAVDVA